MGAESHEDAVVAQEAEFEITQDQAENCSVRPDVPQLYFSADMKGYGCCFRNQNFLNIGLGRLDQHNLPTHVANFLQFLKTKRKPGFDVSAAMLGHAYLLYGSSHRNIVSEGVLIVGDAAGLAYSQSGEGIRPAIESGLLAARAIIAANGIYNLKDLENYHNLLTSRFGKSDKTFLSVIGRHLPS
jgi:flavin-dependent dehydrogenase